MSDKILPSEILEQLREYQASLKTSPAIRARMEDALEDLKTLPIPGKKFENWKYTASAKMLESINAKAPTTVVLDEAVLAPACIDPEFRLVLSNGQLLEQYSKLPADLELKSASEIDILPDWACEETEAPEEDLYYSYLNLAALQNLVSLKVKKNDAITTPLTIVHIISKEAEGALISPRILIEAETGSELEVVEVYQQQDKNFSHHLHIPHTYLNVQAGAHVSHVRVFNEGPAAKHIGHVKAEVARDANFKSFQFTVGGLQSRHNIYVNLNDQAAHCDVHGLYTLRDEQHADHYSRISHFKSYTTSEQLYKGILDGVSHGIFTGKVFIERDAIQVDASQLNKNLLLAKKAHANTRPQLEVYADDVKAAHGATVGQISDDEKFYLETRGIPPRQATRMLGHGFAQDVINKVQDKKIQSYLSNILYQDFEKFALEEL